MVWIALGIGVALAIALWVRFRSPRPAFMPLTTAPDDPLLEAATRRARATVGRFLELRERFPEDAFVKVPFTSSQGHVEHLAAHVEGMDGDMLDILLVTPPVTHAGHVERRRKIAVTEIEDWQVTEPAGAIHGGFTQRAMFEIARRDGVALPRQLRDMEAKYLPLGPGGDDPGH